MNTNLLQTKRRWNWIAYIVLIGLNILAAIALELFHSYQPGANVSPDWEILWMTVLQRSALAAVYAGIGLFVANRIGLGLPIVEGWVNREPVSVNFRKIIPITWIAGVVIGFGLLFLANEVFGAPMQAMFQELGIPYPQAAEMSPVTGLRVSLYGGIGEETIVRLAGLTLIAWLCSLLFLDKDGRPKLAVLWVANILLALYFGYGHLNTAASIGWPMKPLIITRTLVVNGIAGLVFGWLYWKYGLESAMLAHFFADIMIQTVNPFIAMWQGEAARTAAFSGAAAVIMFTLIWAGGSLISASRKGTRGRTLKTA